MIAKTALKLTEALLAGNSCSRFRDSLQKSSVFVENKEILETLYYDLIKNEMDLRVNSCTITSSNFLTAIMLLCEQRCENT